MFFHPGGAPVKRRGPPPSSKPGTKPGESNDAETETVLKPIKKMNPVSSPNNSLNITSDDEDA